jgi:hypothetical protein
MQAEHIVLDREKARALWRDYRKHQHWSKPVDHEIMKTYKAIAQGRVVIKALESIRLQGLNAEKLPKLAIARATAQFCWLRPNVDGSAVFADTEPAARWYYHYTRQRIAFPAGSFPGIDGRRWVAKSVVPLIPLDLRPKRALANYHVLWEAEWELRPPVDPMLLRRVGQADLWIVVAAWELSSVEQAVLAGRLNG